MYIDFASYILITNNSKISKTIFTFLIIISSQIHTVFLFYLSLLFFNTKFEKVITKLIAIVSLFIVIVTFANGNKPPFIENILNLVLSGNDERLTRYLTSGNFGFLIPTFLHLYSLFLVVFLLQKIDFTRLPKINIDFLKLIMYTNLVSVAIIPLTMMNMNFYRMFRSCFLFSMIGIISIIRSNSIDRKIKFEITLLVVILTLLWIGFETYNVTIPIWKPVFEGELFWK
ncbi:EpsG family protein [Streptococcus uberis]|uniref:EpsG family protein n=1 Tax=Streptococcus uberis TaxID=1349 RepID=UPI001FF663A1|nr:EpsG family protein [Streptococcus uberis]